MVKEKRTGSFGKMAASAALVLGATAVTAEGQQSGQARTGVLEEIVVVAQKREQSLQDVGISITAFTSNTIKSLGWSTSEDIAAQVPGLTSSKSNGSDVSYFNIRGVGQTDYGTHHESPNAIYIDDVYVASASAAGMPMFDLERVEVLRGPQGTLFGRNATGGLVHFISNKPSREKEASISVEAGEYNLVRAEGVISGPISDIASGRLALYSTNADGYVENEIGPDLREEGRFAARGQILWDLSDSTELLLKADGFTEDVDAGIFNQIPSFTDADGVNQFVPPDLNVYGVPGGDIYGYRDDGDPHTVRADQIGFTKKDVYGVTADLTHDFQNVTLTSITHFSSVESEHLTDADSSPFAQVVSDFSTDVSQVSQELRLNGGTNDFTWITGLYFLDIDGDEFINGFELPTLAGFLAPGMFPGDGSGTGEGTGVDQQAISSLDTTSWAAFVHGEWSLSNQLALTLGFRWTDDEKDFELEGSCISEVPGTCSFLGFTDVGDVVVDGVNFGPAINDIPGGVSLERSDGDWSGKAQLDYRPTEDLLLYAGARKGFKAGGFTATPDGLSPVSALPFGPEELFSYEIGGKYEFGVGRLNVGAYVYDYQDFQSFEFTGVGSKILNKDADYVGGEVELELAPMDGLDLRFGASYLDAKVDDIVTPQGVQEQQPINAPEWQANWLARKSFPVGNGWLLSFQYDGSWTDDRFFNIVNFPVVAASSYTLHNARVAFEDVTGQWSVAVSARNLTDEEYITSAFDSTAFGWSIQKYGPPRWISGSVTYRFW